ncbi:hypothetical protein LXA43DRAFT_910050 [Ganoderma leucocontextum]|nr:hypothetical protein LXA43DRAFT_910050 [Ganoderma leucocontextum]
MADFIQALDPSKLVIVGTAMSFVTSVFSAPVYNLPIFLFGVLAQEHSETIQSLQAFTYLLASSMLFDVIWMSSNSQHWFARLVTVLLLLLKLPTIFAFATALRQRGGSFSGLNIRGNDLSGATGEYIYAPGLLSRVTSSCWQYGPCLVASPPVLADGTATRTSRIRLRPPNLPSACLIPSLCHCPLSPKPHLECTKMSRGSHPLWANQRGTSVILEKALYTTWRRVYAPQCVLTLCLCTGHQSQITASHLAACTMLSLLIHSHQVRLRALLCGVLVSVA